MTPNYVVAVTGASGAIYAARLIKVLLTAGCNVHASISRAAVMVLKQELDLHITLEDFDASMLFNKNGTTWGDDIIDAEDEATSSQETEARAHGRIFYYHQDDLQSQLASGSFLTDGMIVCPCTGGTLGAIANGISTNLIHRAAEVHLKEKRKLILVVRETPLSLIHLENMTKVAAAGGTILPATPAFYHGATSMNDLVDFVVSKVCDQLQVRHSLIKRWGT